MARHFYHIPLQNTLQFIKTYKSTLSSLSRDKKSLEYYKQLGKSYYFLEIEEFIDFFKIELNHSLNTLAYFNSDVFMVEIERVLNFSQFELERYNIETKEFFYLFCYLYVKREYDNFDTFIQKTFLYFNTSLNTKSNIYLQYKEMSHTLAKSKNISIRESFGEDSRDGFFKIFLDDNLIIQERGKRIKTLRKRAYKNLFDILLQWEEDKIEKLR